MRPKALFAALAVALFALAAAADLEAQENPLFRSWERHLELEAGSEFGLEWVSVGPVMNGARAACVQGDPTRPGTLYAAFGPGGLWKTTDNGLTWKPVFENQAAPGIGDVALAPSRPETIWLGTGVDLKKPRNFTMPGTGVYRSDDGGTTWRHLGLEDSYHIGKIDVHPANPDVAFVAVHGHYWTTNPNRGLYRTLDGGATWEHVLYVDERTGANDVIIAPSDPSIVYATTWENNPGVSGSSSGVWKSEDAGKSWRRLGGGLPSGPKTGRIGLAVSSSDPAKAYVLVDNLNKSETRGAEVYKTTDGGLTWARTHAQDLLIFPQIGWYFADIYLESEGRRGGLRPGRPDRPQPRRRPEFRPPRRGRLSSFPQSGPDPPSRPLRDVDRSRQSRPSGGRERRRRLYDLRSGPDMAPSQQHPRRGVLRHLRGQPGSLQDLRRDPGRRLRLRAARRMGPPLCRRLALCLARPLVGGRRLLHLRRPGGSRDRLLSPRRTGRLAARTCAQGSPYPSCPGCRRASKAGRSTISSRRTSSPPTTASPCTTPATTSSRAPTAATPGVSSAPIWPARPTPPDLSTAAGAIAESPLDPGVLYLGTDRGAFWVTLDDGATWVERSAGLPPNYIRSICPSRFSRTRVYVAAPGINRDDLGCRLFASEDRGLTWTSISADLPDEVGYAVLEDPTNEDILYAGLLRGVYVSVDRGRTWARLGPGLPAAAVSDLVIQEREMDLVASTYGRGIFVMNVRPIQKVFRKGAAPAEVLFDPPRTRLPLTNDTHAAGSLKTVEKVPLTFFLTRPRDVTLSVVDGKGQQVKSWRVAGKKGFNQLRWDLVVKTEDSPEPYFVRYRTFAPAGEYEVRLTGDGLDLRARLKIEERTAPPD
ncbi:MAG: hypothetical protein M0C28_41865 [Candidatus Moduliflexus flocculans]|nr:hypothetical protein [Candidatus Moduliflexus flocculans]